jgi:hypothetical protein
MQTAQSETRECVSFEKVHLHMPEPVEFGRAKPEGSATRSAKQNNGDELESRSPIEFSGPRPAEGRKTRPVAGLEEIREARRTDIRRRAGEPAKLEVGNAQPIYGPAIQGLRTKANSEKTDEPKRVFA